MQSLTSPNWVEPAPTRKSMLPQENHLGFQIDIPHAAPFATPWYHGENPVRGRRELVMRADPEYFSVNGIIPYLAEGIPLVDIKDPAYAFDRSKFTVKA